MDHPSPPQQLPISARWCLTSQRCIDLEVARTPDQQRMGLMQRPRLPALRGMWFPFDQPRPLSFWMFNTIAPLDMLFLRGGTVIAIARRFRSVRRCPVPATGRISRRMGWWNWRRVRRIVWASSLAIWRRLRQFSNDIV